MSEARDIINKLPEEDKDLMLQVLAIEKKYLTANTLSNVRKKEITEEIIKVVKRVYQ